MSYQSAEHLFRIAGMLWLADSADVQSHRQLDEYDSYAREITRGPITWERLAANVPDGTPDRVVNAIAEYLDLKPPVPAGFCRVNGVLYGVADHPGMPEGDLDPNAAHTDRTK